MTELEIKKFIAESINNGMTLNNIQKALADDHGVRRTFLELRLLAAEVEEIDWSRQDPVEKAPEQKEEKPAVNVPEGEPGQIVLEVSKITRPGAVMNGTVRFPSGITGEWLLDQMGRPDFDNLSGQPTQEDIQAFIQELRNKLGGAR